MKEQSDRAGEGVEGVVRMSPSHLKMHVCIKTAFFFAPKCHY